MKKIVLTMMSTAMLLTLASCSNNTDAVFPDSSKAEVNGIGTFDSYKYLLYYDNDNNPILKDEDGNVYELNPDGYYYDKDGNRISDYGIGEEIKNKNVVSHPENNVEYETDESGNIIGFENPIVEPDYDDALTNKSDSGNVVIHDWEAYRQQIEEQAGIKDTEPEKWYGEVEDELEDIKPYSGDNALSSGKEYNTVMDIAGDIPSTLAIDSLQTGRNTSISGKIKVDMQSFNEHMVATYGETQQNEAGELVPADYNYVIKESRPTISLYAYSDTSMDTYSYDCIVTEFNDSGELTFSGNASIPEGYTCVLYVNGVPYTISK